MTLISTKKLLDAGVHFGHPTQRWNPKMKRFIHTSRRGVYILDLKKSLEGIEKAYLYVKKTVSNGGTILFVGSKKQAQDIIQAQAKRVDQPYVNQRWLGGLLTNFQTVQKRLGRLRELDLIDYSDTSLGYTKKELLLKDRERAKLERSLGGIRNMSRLPSALWVVDTNRERLAVIEAKKLGIPVIAILDTNCDPDDVEYPIPGNDDAIKSVELLTYLIANAVAEGLILRHQKKSISSPQDAEPLAEWEVELLKDSPEPTSGSVA